MKGFFFMVLIGIGSGAGAMPIKTRLVRSRAYFQKVPDQDLLEALDLKSKTLTFTKKDFDECGLKLMRKSQTLTYSCTLPIPSQARTSKLQKLLSPSSTPVVFGGTKRDVEIQVSEDARSVTFVTAFDSTGVDFDVQKFNDDFFKVYDKVAQIVISEALTHQPVRMEVLESRPQALTVKKQ